MVESKSHLGFHTRFLNIGRPSLDLALVGFAVSRRGWILKGDVAWGPKYQTSFVSFPLLFNWLSIGAVKP